MPENAPLICLVSAQFAPSRGGVEQYTQNLATALQARGYRVLVVCQNTHHVAQEEWIENVQVLRFPCISIMDKRFPLPKYNAQWRQCVRRLHELSPEYMLVNTRIYPFSVHALQFAKKHGIRPILLDHGSGHLSLNNPILSRCIACYEHIITFFIKHLCQDFYSVSKAGAAWLTHYGIKARGVIYNAVDIVKMDKICQEQKRSRKGVRPSVEGPLRVLYAGRLLPEKGVQKLIGAVEEAEQTGCACLLTLAGDGPLYAQLKQQESKTMRVLGSIPFSEVVQQMADHDVFVLPTDCTEGFPTSILEAAAMGCYCITTNMGGSKELLSSREYGVILEENTVDNLKKELVWANNHIQQRQKIAIAAQLRVEEQFTWQQTAQVVLAAFGLQDEEENSRRSVM